MCGSRIWREQEGHSGSSSSRTSVVWPVLFSAFPSVGAFVPSGLRLISAWASLLWDGGGANVDKCKAICG